MVLAHIEPNSLAGLVETAYMATEESHRKSADRGGWVCLIGMHTGPDMRGKSVVFVKKKLGSGGV